MIILPAIDIRGGNAVRLYQGDYNKEEIVANDIMETARTFQVKGAQFLHLVDLDGAKDGVGVNHHIIIRIAKELDIPVEVGGGIRDMKTIDHLLSNGVKRVILGTVAMEDKELVKEAVTKYNDGIAVGIDCKDGYACGRGWLSESSLHYIDFAKEMESYGVDNIIVTDISRDGTLTGPNIEMLTELKKEVNIKITASGGIKDIEDIKVLKEIDVYGTITGKAIYANTLDLEEAIEVCK